MIPNSISEIYYKLGNKGWAFQTVLFIIASVLLPLWTNKTDDSLQFIPFISCFSLMLVALAPQFKISLEGPIHYVSAVLCGVCAVVWLLLYGYIYVLLSCLIFAILLTCLDYTKYMFWLECAIMISVFYAI